MFHSEWYASGEPQAAQASRVFRVALLAGRVHDRVSGRRSVPGRALARAVLARWGARLLPFPVVSARTDVQAVFHNPAAPVVDVYGLREPSAPDRGDDFPQVVHIAAPVVLRHVPDDEYTLRNLCEAGRARDRRELQDRCADDAPDPYPDDTRRR